MAAEGKAPPLTRRDIFERLRGRLGLSALEAKKVLEAFLEGLAGQLEKGDPAVLSGLGRFSVKKGGQGRAKPAFSLSRSLRETMKK